MTAHAHSLNENGRALAEAAAPPVVTDQGPSHHGDRLNLASAAAITQRCVEAFKLVRIFEEIFGGVPVKNMAGRFRAAEAQDQIAIEELCECGLYPARLNGLCVGCITRSRHS